MHHWVSISHSLVPAALSSAFALLSLAAPTPELSVFMPPASYTGATLAPTQHPPVPAEMDRIWLVPSEEQITNMRIRIRGLSALGIAARLLERQEPARALALIDMSLYVGTPLADYADYYRGLALFGLLRLDEARQVFATIRAREPAGYLWEGATMKEAEVAEAQQDYAAAASLYRMLGERKPANPDLVWQRLGQAALAAGDRPGAAQAFARLHYEFPLSDLASSAATALRDLQTVLPPASARVPLDLGRAEQLFQSRRYADACAAFAALVPLAGGDQRDRVRLRMAECDYHLKRSWKAIEGLRPYLARGPYQAEASFFYLTALRAVGRHDTYLQRARPLIEAFPESSWAEETLNDLASYYLLTQEDDKAAAMFAELYGRFPTGPSAARAAWKAGWWAYRQRRLADAIRFFESAAATFPRSDYRPGYLYWAGRAHERLGDRTAARERYALAVTDYGSTYYGRLASKLVDQRMLTTLAVVPRASAPADEGASEDEAGAVVRPEPPTAALMRQLAAADLFVDLGNELAYAQRAGGTSPAIEATLAWVHNRTGELRLGINAMKRAYPQYMTAGGAGLPEPILRVLFPLAYWDLIRGYATTHGLDRYLVAALVAQESTFDPTIRSSANAYGLMQILPSTGRSLARRLGLRYGASMLVDPDANVRMGTRHFSDLMKRFGKPHLALAGYNAGEHRVVRWLAERSGLDLTDDEFVEDIPFPETQNYVKRILGTAEDYRRIYGSR